MAALWNALRQELQATVEDLRDKGAVGALRDAALDIRDIAADTTSWVRDGVQELVAHPGGADDPVLRCTGRLPVQGMTVPIDFPSRGETVDVVVLEVDDASEPARVHVQLPSTGQSWILPVLSVDPLLEDSSGHESEQVDRGGAWRGVQLELQQEWQSTVDDFREKGAVGALTDAALDAGTFVGHGARTLAGTVAPHVESAASTAFLSVQAAAGKVAPHVETMTSTAVSGAKTAAWTVGQRLQEYDLISLEEAAAAGPAPDPAVAEEASAVRGPSRPPGARLGEDPGAAPTASATQHGLVETRRKQFEPCHGPVEEEELID